MRRGRPIPTFVVTDEERRTLEGWARRPKTAQALAQRARMILACAAGKTNGAVATEAGVTRQHGTTTLFAALDAKSGKVLGEFHRRHRAIDFRKFLDTIDAAVPAHLDVHLILDNYSTHKTPTIHRWLARRYIEATNSHPIRVDKDG